MCQQFLRLKEFGKYWNMSANKLIPEWSGGNYKTMINEAWRSYTQRQEELLEETRRLVIREELRGAG